MQSIIPYSVNGVGIGQPWGTGRWQATQPVNAGYLAATYPGSLQAVEQTYRALRSQYVVS